MPDTCSDCAGPIGQDKGPPDGWQLEDGRTVCHACCVSDFIQLLHKHFPTPATKRGLITGPRSSLSQ